MPTSAPATGAPTAGVGQFRADFSASISVFLIALPLSLGIALATGAPLQAGLVAAAVGGIVVGRLGGAPLQVSGPAAGLTVVTADLIQAYGWRVTCAITVLAGLTQLLLSAARVARTALVVSPAIVHGMLAGIGVTIAVAQLHIVLGGSPESSVISNLAELPSQLANLHVAAVVISTLTIAVLLLWPRLPGRAGAQTRRALPAALAAVTLATVVAAVSGLQTERVDLPSWSSHALPQLPEGPVLGLLAGVLTVTLVASVESLLSAVAVDKLATARQRNGGPARPKTDLDKELRGQGAANVLSGSLGGLPITGVAVRSAANVAAGAVTRRSTILHGCWVLLATGLLVGLLELIPLAALAALVMVVGIQMVNLTHIRSVTKHREMVAYGATMVSVVFFGVLEGVGIGIAVGVAVALHRLTHTRITREQEPDGSWLVRVRGHLTFLAVPRLTRALGEVPEGTVVRVELDGSFMDHAASETLNDWCATHQAQGGRVEVTGRSGEPAGSPILPPPHPAPSAPASSAASEDADGPQQPHAAERARPWRPWRAWPHRTSAPADGRAGPRAPLPAPSGEGGTETSPPDQLLSGVQDFQRSTAPLVRDNLARLAREGQRPTQLFLTCADSRLVTSMITSSGPGDLYTVRNIGNLVPPPGSESTETSVAAALEYAVTVLQVRTITVCGHSDCAAMQHVHEGRDAAPGTRPVSSASPLQKWLTHARPSLDRLQPGRAPERRHTTSTPHLADAPTLDPVEALSLANVVQQLEHLARHDCVAARVREGSLTLRGMYFEVGEAQAYVMEPGGDGPAVFSAVHPDVLAH